MKVSTHAHVWEANKTLIGSSETASLKEKRNGGLGSTWTDILRALSMTRKEKNRGPEETDARMDLCSGVSQGQSRDLKRARMGGERW